ncbi:MAG: NADH-quinone oxidoreductase subunit L [Candidatus Hydrothermales bacterium]
MDLGTLSFISWWAPFLSFLIIGFFTRKKGRFSAYLSIGAIFLSLILSILIILNIEELKTPISKEIVWLPAGVSRGVAGANSIYFGFYLDRLSAIMLFVVALVAFAVQVYSIGYMSEESSPSLGRYYAYHSLFAFSMIGLTLSKNILQIFVFWELVGLCSYLLIGFYYYKPEAARAALKAFWITKLGDVGFIIGILILYFKFGVIDIHELINKPYILKEDFNLGSLVLILIFCGAVGKSAQFPLHIWLPDAMEGPTPVSALIHAATMVAAGVYLVSRLFPVFELFENVMWIIAIIGSFTAFLSATMALVQEDIKRILAYSTISQLGYMMAALGVGSIVAGFFHLFTHAYFKALLFLGAGAAIHAVHSNSIWHMGGIFRKAPITSLTFGIGTLALCGIPPFSGFYSKEEIIIKTYYYDNKLPFLFLIVTVFLTAFYMGRAYTVAFLTKPRTKEAQDAHDPDFSMSFSLILLAIFSIFAGFYHEKISHLLSYLQGSEFHHSKVSTLPKILSLLLAFLGLFFSYYLYSAKPLVLTNLKLRFSYIYTVLQRRYYIDDIFEWIYRKIVVLLSVLASWWDRHIVDGIVNWVVYNTGRIGRSLRVIQTGIVQDYAFYIVIGATFMLILILRGF